MEPKKEFVQSILLRKVIVKVGSSFIAVDYFIARIKPHYPSNSDNGYSTGTLLPYLTQHPGKRALRVRLF